MSLDQTVTLQEHEDGELFFEIPDVIWEQLGWDEGTVLDWAVVGDSIRITKVPDELLGQPGMAGNVTTVERSHEGMDEPDDGVVGEPSY